jgi:hypothetical protein
MGVTPANLAAAMSIFWTAGRTRVLAATRERHATAPSDPKPRRTDDVRRGPDASIDIAFYQERAQRLRQEATLRL